MSQEIELKLSLPKSSLAALRRHPLFIASPPVGPRQTLINTYFDTPALLLKSRRIALRTRKQGRTWLQTVKCGGEFAGGLSHRPEWEHPYRGRFDFTPVDVPEVQALLEAQADQLQPVLTTTFRRETRRYHNPNGAEILLMLDVGTVEAAGRCAPLCELELELVAGGPSDLFDLALALAADLPLLPDDVSKAQRGYQLFLNQTPVPVKSRPSPIQAGDAPQTAFQALALEGLRQWQANAHGVASGDNPEFIHQMRVALRRLRSLLRMMAPLLPPAFVDEWRQRLGEEAARLGPVRDLDVLISAILTPVERQLGPTEGLSSLRQKAEARRAQVQRQTRFALARSHPGQTLLAFGAALHALADNPPASPGIDLHTFARGRLRWLQKRVQRRLAAVRAEPGPDNFHALRIALKNLRYGLEFFLPLCAPGAAKRRLEKIALAQDELGFLHDFAAGSETVLAWTRGRPALREAAQSVIAFHTPRARALTMALPNAVAPWLDKPLPLRKP